MKFKKFFSHPLTIIGSIIFGILFGILAPEVAADCGDIGTIYLRGLQMCVLPLVATAIFNSVVNLVQTRKQNSGLIGQLFFVFVTGIVLAVFAGSLFGLILHYGEGMSSSAKAMLGSYVNSQAQDLGNGPGMNFSNTSDFFNLIIPANPFTAFADGSGLKIVFFCIVMAISFAFGRKKNVDLIVKLSEEVYDSCIRVLNFMVLFLPIGLFFLFAKQFGELSLEIFQSLGRLLMVMIIGTLFLTFCNILVIKFTHKITLVQAIKGLSSPLIMAFGTASGFATLPKIIDAMQKRFGAKDKIVTLTAPLATNMSPQGTAIAIVIFAMFFIHLYNIHLNLGIALTIFIGAAMISIAISGLPGIVGVSMIATLLEAIVIPAGVATVILMALLPLVDPFLTMLNCAGICTYCIVLNHWQNKKVPQEKWPRVPALAANQELQKTF